MDCPQHPPSHQDQGSLRSESFLHLAPGMTPSSFCMKPRLPTVNKALCDLLLPPSLPLSLSVALLLLSSKVACHSCQLWTMLTCQEYSPQRNFMTNHPLPGSLCRYSQQVASDQYTACTRQSNGDPPLGRKSVALPALPLPSLLPFSYPLFYVELFFTVCLPQDFEI